MTNQQLSARYPVGASWAGLTLAQDNIAVSGGAHLVVAIVQAETIPQESSLSYVRGFAIAGTQAGSPAAAPVDLDLPGNATLPGAAFVGSRVIYYAVYEQGQSKTTWETHAKWYDGTDWTDEITNARLVFHDQDSARGYDGIAMLVAPAGEVEEAIGGDIEAAAILGFNYAFRSDDPTFFDGDWAPQRQPGAAWKFLDPDLNLVDLPE